MIRKFFLAGMILLVTGITIAGMQLAYGQEANAIENIDDNTVIVVIVAAVTGGMAAPIIGYAAKKEDSKFNWKQYAMAVAIVVPSSLGLIMMEIIALEMNVSNLASIVVLYIMVFTQALGIDYGKSRAKKAITN